MLELNKLYNMDCMEGMKEIPDKYFDLAIVDPPYGDANNGDGGGGTCADGSTDTKWNRFGGWFDRYKVEQVELGRVNTAKKS